MANNRIIQPLDRKGETGRLSAQARAAGGIGSANNGLNQPLDHDYWLVRTENSSTNQYKFI